MRWVKHVLPIPRGRQTPTEVSRLVPPVSPLLPAERPSPILPQHHPLPLKTLALREMNRHQPAPGTDRTLIWRRINQSKIRDNDWMRAVTWWPYIGLCAVSICHSTATSNRVVYVYVYICIFFWSHDSYGKWGGWLKLVNHTSRMIVVTQTYCSNLVCICIIKLYRDVFVVLLIVCQYSL